MKPRFESLDELLGHFDQRSEPFREWDVESALITLKKQLIEIGGPIPEAIDYELEAFAFHDRSHFSRDKKDGWFGEQFSARSDSGEIITYPNKTAIPQASIAHWAARAEAASHPILRFRYSALVWSFGHHADRTMPRLQMAQSLIDAAVRISANESHQFECEIIGKLAKALETAIKINDEPRRENVVQALIDLEDKIAKDQMLGLWGFSLDLLCSGNRIPISEQQERKLIDDMEARLARLVDRSDARQLEPFAIEAAAKRLAKFYRRHSQHGDVERVLSICEQAVVRNSAVVSALMATSNLQRMCALWRGFNLPERASALSVRLKERAAECKHELIATTHEFQIPKQEMDAFVDGMTRGDLDEVLMRIAVNFSPRVDELQKEAQSLSEQYPLASMFPQSMLSDERHQTAAVGSVNSDLAGNVTRLAAKHMKFSSIYLWAVFERLRSNPEVTVDRVINFLFESPLVESEDHSIWEAGIRAFWSGKWIEAIHILVPRIEQVVRRLVEWQGNPVLKNNRNGGFHLKTFDELLRDDRALHSLGNDGTWYFQTLFTDPRGWNIRNGVCHGLLPSGGFNHAVADRVFHAVLVLRLLEQRPTLRNQTDQ